MATTETAIEKPKRQGFWDNFIGKRIVVQTKGRIIMTGKFVTSTPNGFIVLEKPTIKGMRVQARPPQVFIDRAQIGHFHEECETDKLDQES